MSAAATQFGTFDVCCALFLLFSCLVGYWRGLVFEVLTLLAWLGAILSALWGAPIAQHWLPKEFLTENATLRYAAASLLIFIAVRLLLGLVARAARKGFAKIGLRSLDRLLGLGFGSLRAVFFLGLFALLISLTSMQQSSWWVKSPTAFWLNESLQTFAPTLRAQVQRLIPPLSNIQQQPSTLRN